MIGEYDREATTVAGSSPFHTMVRAVGEHAVVLYGFAASRLTLLAIGLLTQIHIRPITVSGNSLRLSDRQALNIWGAWDSGWYVDLAVNGYQRLAGADGQANWAFFPAFPFLAGGLARLTGLTPFQAMIAISNLAFLAALLLIHRLARAEFNRRSADLAVVLLCVAPGSYIFSAAYTEALFMACVAGALLLMRSRRWMAAGIVAAGAALTRNLGVGLLLPYGWTVMERLLAARGASAPETNRPGPAEWIRIGLGGLAPLAAVAGFMLYLRARTGDALAFLHVQKAWNRNLDLPFSATIRGLLHPGGVHDADLLSLSAACLAIGLLAALATMRRWTLLALGLFLTLVPLATGLASFGRYMLVIVPLWLALAKLLADRPRAAIICVAALAMLNGFMMVAWTLALRIVA